MPRSGDMTATQLREARRSIGLTQRVWAARIGVSVGSVSCWERGKKCASAAHQHAALAVLCVALVNIGARQMERLKVIAQRLGKY